MVFVNILGGLRVIKDPNLKNYLLDITIVKNTSFLDLLFNIPKLYNGDIIHHRKVTNYKTRELKILDNYNSTIEADGEIIGNGSLYVTIIRNTLQFFSI